jgi:hypothetical protein
MTEKTDWNAYFRERKAAQDLERSQALSKAKAAAAHTDKEPFDARRFKKIYKRLNPSDLDEVTSWKSMLKESEYDYYVNQKDKNTLEEYIEYLRWLEGFG